VSLKGLELINDGVLTWSIDLKPEALRWRCQASWCQPSLKRVIVVCDVIEDKLLTVHDGTTWGVGARWVLIMIMLICPMLMLLLQIPLRLRTIVGVVYMRWQLVVQLVNVRG